MFYAQSVLFNSGWVRDKATVLALNYLSERRGNPELYTNRVLKVYEELEMIRSGRLTLPRVAERGQGGPMVRNQELETFRRYHPLRVEATLTMQGDSYPGQDIAWENPFPADVLADIVAALEILIVRSEQSEHGYKLKVRTADLIAKSMGKGLMEFKKGIKDIENEIRDELDD